MLQRPAQRLGVTTPEMYEQFQRAVIAGNREADRVRRTKSGPWSGDYRDPFDVPVAQNPPVYVGGGAWLVRCPCGDASSVDPEWRLARCCCCGRVFSNLVLPANLSEIEDVLLRRPHVLRMNWHPAETLEDLKAENVKYGVDIVGMDMDPHATIAERLAGAHIVTREDAMKGAR